MNKFADLHLHTVFSDGSFTPEEVMKQAKKHGLSCIAIADHDGIDSIKETSCLREKYDLEIIPAVEMTSQEGEKELHILGYFIDPADKNLTKKLKQICESRIERVYKMSEKLRQHRINADAREILEFAKGGVISRLHVARYLLAKGFVPSLKVAFDKYIGDGKPCYISRFRFFSKEVINTIKQAGGIAVIAHPGLNNVIGMLPTLAENGIDGIEVFYPEHVKSATDNLKDFASKHNLLITGGSDCHGANKREALIGKVKLPYTYVQAMKDHCKKIHSR